MSFIILLDSGPLGLVTHPKANPEADACKQWLQKLPEAGHLPLVPGIIDYETRREILRRNNSAALRLLDRLKLFGYLPLTDNALMQAAQFWATARQQGIPTADQFALDADMILAGQAASLNPDVWQMPGASIVVATANVGHLNRFVDARLWQNIP